ncbi:hypothetical protein [Pseudonocardia sp. MH-G8]|uniref:hypothetical protein n=1 Tax=Pseudonocardia sp. MH-G8 TaxID=1854588 RepID=UPI00117B7ACD|nr:hypothetical protein [Pseudonocardia sp. MH-G8]
MGEPATGLLRACGGEPVEPRARQSGHHAHPALPPAQMGARDGRGGGHRDGRAQRVGSRVRPQPERHQQGGAGQGDPDERSALDDQQEGRDGQHRRHGPAGGDLEEGGQHGTKARG